MGLAVLPECPVYPCEPDSRPEYQMSPLAPCIPEAKGPRSPCPTCHTLPDTSPINGRLRLPTPAARHIATRRHLPWQGLSLLTPAAVALVPPRPVAWRHGRPTRVQVQSHVTHLGYSVADPAGSPRAPEPAKAPINRGGTHKSSVFVINILALEGGHSPFQQPKLTLAPRATDHSSHGRAKQPGYPEPREPSSNRIMEHPATSVSEDMVVPGRTSP
ncbi:hypothetical protein TIFTF001_055330 [Ficus carica]|uniref:Uncharacterized protein n=1 Tax=Ficus carica TaxID=3494 RepID=A0AA88JGH8_FICCA|nr:hypothetical protein TIFTF001_055330 [Ficus carica]